MESKLYTVGVKIGSLVEFEFYAVKMQDDNKTQLHFLRQVTSSQETDANRGALYINLADNNIGFSYDCAFFKAKITNKKEVGDGNYIFDCASDDIHWEVIVADADLWEKEGKLMFA